MKVQAREIILTVDNMQKQVEFYRDVVGLELHSPNLDYTDAMLATFDTGYCTFRLHANMSGSTFKNDAKYLLTFEVDDIEKSVKELQSVGIEMSPIKENTPGKFTSSFKDPEGNLIRIGSFK